MDNYYLTNLNIGPLVCEAIHPRVKVGIDVLVSAKPAFIRQPFIPSTLGKLQVACRAAASP